MLRKPNYIYGPSDNYVPANLNFGDFILGRLWQNRDRKAITNAATHETVTYGEIAQQAMKLALSLTRMGVRKGHMIAVSSENRFEFVSTIIGVTCTGATATTVNFSYTKDELKHVLDISKPSHIFCSPLAYKAQGATYRSLRYVKQIILYGGERQDSALLYNDLIAATRAELRGDVSVEQFQAAEVRGQTDTLFVLYSSGTTGLPKGAMLTHLNVLTIMNTFPPATVDPDPVSLSIAPWFHTMGLMSILACLCMPKYVVYMPKFEVEFFLNTIEKYKVTQATVVPPVLVALCKAPSKHDVTSLRLIFCGAAPLRGDTVEAALARFPNVVAVLQGYGMTEATLTVTKDDPNDPCKPGGIGKVGPVTVVKVVDLETGKPLGPNKPGEIRVKGLTIMKGYIGKDKKEDLDEEGFYKTGDIGYYDENQVFFIVDRLKELIKYKGYQVPPAEVEAVLLQHPAVRDAAVVGVPRVGVGEVPRAFVVPQPGLTITETELKDFVAEKLSNPKQLRGGVRFVDAIPKNPSGKILRRELRKMATADKSKL